MKRTKTACLVFGIIILAFFSSIDASVFKRSSLDLHLTFWSEAKSEKGIDPEGLFEELDFSGLGARLVYNYHFNNRFSFFFSLGILTVQSTSNISVQDISSTSSEVFPILFGMKFYLIGSNVKPYVSCGAGVFLAHEYRKYNFISDSTRFEAAVGVSPGAGVDFLLGDLMKFTAGASYNLISDYNDYIAGKSNFSGPEIHLGFGIRF